MQAISKKTLPLHFLIILLCYFFTFSASKQHPENYFYCGKLKIESSFLRPNSSSVTRMITCISDQAYFRTSIGLFHVSSIDYKTKTFVVSHSSCSSLQNFIPPSLLSSGFPSAPLAVNSVVFFNCSEKPNHGHDCTRLPSCGAASDSVSSESCSAIDDVLEDSEMGSLTKGLNCSHYRRVYRNLSAKEDNNEGIGLGTRVSFDIPDHVPELCNECNRPNGNCGIGLRCLCHPKQYKDRVISATSKLQVSGNMLTSVLVAIALLVPCV